MSVSRFAIALLAGLVATAAFAQAPAPQPAPVPTAPAAPAAPMPAAPVPQGKAWILMDHVSGQVLAGENYDTALDPASITKVMTSYVVAAEMANGKIKPTDSVRISENAWRSFGPAQQFWSHWRQPKTPAPLTEEQQLAQAACIFDVAQLLGLSAAAKIATQTAVQLGRFNPERIHQRRACELGIQGKYRLIHDKTPKDRCQF